MVQILEEQPNFLQRLGMGLGQAGQAASQAIPQLMQQRQQQIAERQFAQKLGLGEEFAYLSPEVKKSIIIEKIKGSEKERLQGQKRDYLDQLFSSQQPKMQQEQVLEEQKGSDGKRIFSDEEIFRATLENPQFGAAMQKLNEQNLREQKESPEFKRREKIIGEQAKTDIDYNKELQQGKQLQYIKTSTLDNLEKLNKKGVTGKPFEKFLERTGLINYTSEGRREFAADVKNLITDIRSILGGQFSNFEFQTILNAYPSADFSKEANAAIIDNLKDFQDIRNETFKIAERLKKENKGEIPVDYQAKVNSELDKYISNKMHSIKQNTNKIIKQQYNVKPGHTLLLDPNGEYLAVPDDQVEEIIKIGAMYP